MATKATKKKTTKKPSAKKTTTKREPTPNAILKKVVGVADYNKALQKEIKVMSKIFTGNQKILVSMKGMIDTLSNTLESIQKQSKQLNMLEDDTQKLYAGLNQVRSQSNLVTKINDQTVKLQDEVIKIGEIQKSSPNIEQVEDTVNSIRNNSQMIIKIAQRIDEVRDDLRKVSEKTDSFLESSNEISLKAESISTISSELNSIKTTIDSISGKSEKIDYLGGIIEGLKQQFEIVSARVNAVTELGGKIDKIETEIGSLSHRADSTAFLGEEFKSIVNDVTNLKQNVSDKTNNIDQKITAVSDMLKRQDALSAEFHKKTDKVFQELQSVKNVTNKATSDSSKEMMALLKLSEYQSNIRIHAESKYGDTKDLENMASQTTDIINLFDKLSIESGEKIPLPHEVRQWAVSKILDCSDKWELRFSDVFSILINSIGRDLLKESIRIQQVRDIYGIRAVDEVRNELNIS